MVVSSNLDVLDLVDLLGFVEAFGSLLGYDSRNSPSFWFTEVP